MTEGENVGPERDESEILAELLLRVHKGELSAPEAVRIFRERTAKRPEGPSA